VRSLLASCIGKPKIDFKSFLFSAKDEALNKNCRLKVFNWTKNLSKDLDTLSKKAYKDFDAIRKAKLDSEEDRIAAKKLFSKIMSSRI